MQGVSSVVANKDGVLAVQPLCRREGHEELGPVGVGPCVGHGQQAGPRVLEFVVDFVVEVLAVDGGPPAPRACWVAALYHKITDDTVKFATVIITPPCQFCKISACVRGVLPVQLQSDVTH